LRKNFQIKLILGLLLLGSFAFAQSPVDSLEKSLLTAKEDTNKVKTLALLANNLSRVDPVKAIKYASESLSLSGKLGYKKGEANALTRLGIINYYKGELANALDHLLKALRIFETLEYKKGIASVRGLLGIIYTAKGDFDRGLEQYTVALRSYEQMKDKGGMAGAYNNISVLYYSKKEYGNCLENYSRALALFEELKDPANSAIARNNIGNAYTQLGNYDKALEFYTRSLEIKQEMNDKFGTMESHYSIGKMFYKKGDHAEAKKYFLKAIKGSRELGEMSHLTEAYDFLSRSDSASNDLVSAYADIRHYARVKDSLLSAENLKQFAEMQTKYETEKKELLISNQEKEIDKQTTQKIAFAIGFLLMIGLALVVFRSYKLKKKANEEIMRQKRVIEEKNKEILDSIHYARRIQHSLMPTEKFIERILNKRK